MDTKRDIQALNNNQDISSTSDVYSSDKNINQKVFVQPFEALNGKYTIIEKIGNGAQAHVYKAKDAQGNLVAIKVFDFRQVENWKSIELLKREVGTLQSLSIEGIPKYIDYIDASPYFYLVESYIDACSIKHKIEYSARFDTKQLLEIAEKTLIILNQLHTRMPPVIHRDIKPANLLIDIKDNSIQVWIIDFGSVTAVYSSTKASTLAGTAGYAAPEQLFGQASAATDIYGLGMTILHLATGKAPYEMEVDGLTLNFKKYLPPETLPELIELLSAMIQPNPRDRIQSAAIALAKIRNLKAIVATPNTDLKNQKPTSKICTDISSDKDSSKIRNNKSELSANKRTRKPKSNTITHSDNNNTSKKNSDSLNRDVDYKDIEYYISLIHGSSARWKRYLLRAVHQSTQYSYYQIYKAYEAVEKYMTHTDSRYYSDDERIKADYYIELLWPELVDPGHYERQCNQQKQLKAKKTAEHETTQQSQKHHNLAIPVTIPGSNYTYVSVDDENASIHKSNHLWAVLLLPIVLPVVVLLTIYGLVKLYENCGLLLTIPVTILAIIIILFYVYFVFIKTD